MRSQGSAQELERRRRLAVQRVLDGWKQVDVAAFLGVTERTVSRWMAAYRRGGSDAIKAKPTPGRPPKLSRRREQSVLSWLAKSPKAFGYETDLWTARRLAEVIERRYGVRFNSNYLVAWLTRRDHSPQKPETRPVERDNPAIARWAAEGWPRLQKKRGTRAPTSS
jgi:transposase